MKYKDLDPYEGINFVERRALIKDKNGKVKFDEIVEFPDYFSDSSVNITASKYLCNEAKHKETSIKQMVDRVSNTITKWGNKDGYFKGTEDGESNEELDSFNYKLKYYQIHQYFTFNSPVYFNCGLVDKPQCSACFILEIEDDMESIADTNKLEHFIFKWGSGSGMNMSRLRSSKERVRGGGFASGPVSFLKTQDVSAGVIKSGGTLRRSAKLVCLDISHPDIKKFIHCKELEEKKLKILRDAGIEPEEGYELSDHVFYQNTNISTRIPDEFMMSVEQEEDWWTKYILTGERCEKFSAKELLMEISKAAWNIADPGVQFSDNMNKWNTCANSGDIESTNPCGEFAWHNNSSCNLAALNLLKFFSIDDNGEIKFDFDTFRDVVATVITAQDIIVDNSFYPSRKIINNTHNFRPLGLGYSNLGATLSWLGLPYDSDEGRNIAGMLTALLTGFAFEQSNKLAETLGSFQKFEENKEPYYKVLKLHKEYMHQLIGHAARSFSQREDVVGQLASRVKEIAHMLGDFVEREVPFRNSQVTLLAPTGTTSFMMGCLTNGVEPGYSLISYKTLSGNDGATIKIVNNMVPQILKNLGYSEKEIETLCNELHSIEHFEKSEILKEEHLPIFDTSVTPKGGKRCIDYMGHVKMLAAVQPFLSGAISKTINMPKTATAEDIYELYLKSWKLGLKGVTVYRDGSKEYQPLNATKKEEKQVVDTRAPYKINMPPSRPGEIHKFSIGSTEGYLMTGLLKDGQLGEVFLTVAKQGSTLSGLLDSLAIMISISLQYGVPLKSIVRKLMFTRFDPSGITSNSDVRFATSIVDYLGRYLGNKYLSDEDKIELGLKKFDSKEEIGNMEEIKIIDEVQLDSGDSPVCDCCGGMMQRVGTCFNCNNCGANSGACG